MKRSSDKESGGKGGRRRHSGPTITDVAKKAGVSPMTVSRVINGERVRDDKKRLVNAAIATLGYAPNQAARNLAGAAVQRIALLYNNPSSAYLSELLLGSLEQAQRKQVQLIVEKCEDGEAAEGSVRRLIDAGIDGVILPPPLSDSSIIYDLLSQSGTPVVAVAGGGTADVCSVVGINDYVAAQDMTRHLLSLGHRKIGFIQGNLNQVASAQRLQGFVDALGEAGVRLSKHLVAQGDFTYRSGLLAAEKLLGRARMPTAIFASNDDMAAATVAAAHRLHLDVPTDLTVCGFDDTAVATIVWPELTTIRQPISEISQVAVDLLLDKIRQVAAGGKAKNRLVTLEHRLVQRSSDGIPPQR